MTTGWDEILDYRSFWIWIVSFITGRRLICSRQSSSLTANCWGGGDVTRIVFIPRLLGGWRLVEESRARVDGPGDYYDEIGWRTRLICFDKRTITETLREYHKPGYEYFDLPWRAELSYTSLGLDIVRALTGKEMFKSVLISPPDEMPANARHVRRIVFLPRLFRGWKRIEEICSIDEGGYDGRLSCENRGGYFLQCEVETAIAQFNKQAKPAANTSSGGLVHC